MVEWFLETSTVGVWIRLPKRWSILKAVSFYVCLFFLLLWKRSLGIADDRNTETDFNTRDSAVAHQEW